MSEFSGTVRPDDDRPQYRTEDTPVEGELSRLRMETSNHLLDVSHRVKELKRAVSGLATVCWILLVVTVLLVLMSAALLLKVYA